MSIPSVQPVSQCLKDGCQKIIVDGGYDSDEDYHQIGNCIIGDVVRGVQY